MPLKKGTIVCSKSGRDKGKFMVVLLENENTVLLCDGKERPLEKPKQKNLKHISVTNAFIDEEQMKTNRSIRHALNDFKASNIKGEI